MARPEVETEVVVVGGGIVGSATAYYLAKAGKDVILVEREVIAAQASGRNFGGVRQQGRSNVELPYLMESLRMWGTLDEELGFPTEFRRGGTLCVALTDYDMEQLAGLIARQQQAGLDVRSLTRAEVRSLAPQLTDRALGGSFCPTDGHANPMLATRAFALAAQRLGVRIRERVEVTGITVADGEVRSVSTNQGDIRTKAIVNAAGHDAPAIGRMVGVEIPMTTRGRMQAMVTESVPPILNQYLIGNVGIYRQTVSGNIVIEAAGPAGVSYPPYFGYDNRTLDFEKLAQGARRLIELFPNLRGLNVLRTWSGTTARGLDERPIIDLVDRLRGFVICAGWRNGFAPGPLAGKLAAELVLHGEASMSLEPFRLARFGEIAERSSAGSGVS